ncbi:unnamed protein product [Miscanthus lutarioriparius]|uniref:DDE Tnp4 domain-containing protein n=1 Tax=Miscanthus lutarioriparius TaxID=422564 RepID=A0A811SFW2_9POAL|nr:unnamed protein product [Miscanthus lutarioriparius]
MRNRQGLQLADDDDTGFSTTAVDTVDSSSLLDEDDPAAINDDDVSSPVVSCCLPNAMDLRLPHSEIFKVLMDGGRLFLLEYQCVYCVPGTESFQPLRAVDLLVLEALQPPLKMPQIVRKGKFSFPSPTLIFAYWELPSESSQPAHDKFRRPQCCEQLIMILECTPRDRGELVSAGGHQPDKTPSSGSPRTPPGLLDKPVLPRSGGQPSKRVHREYSVNSPHSSIMSSTDESSYNDTSSDGPSTVILAKAAVVLRRLKDKCTSVEALGMYIWTCSHQSASRECKYRFERSLDIVSRKITTVAEVMYRWASTVLVPADRNYTRVNQKLAAYASWFVGCIGAIDGTHIEIEVNREAKADFFNRKGKTTINVCAIVDMDGHFTYVGAEKARACHDMAVLKDYQDDGRYYLANMGYIDMPGYMTPFRNTRYHMNDFRGVEFHRLQREEKFNYIHAKLQNVIKRRFGGLKECWHILNGVPYCKRKKQDMIVISCFALENYLWMLKYGADPPSYELPEWVELNQGTPIFGVRELISMVVWSGI